MKKKILGACMVLMLLSTACSRYATTGEKLYLKSKNSSGLEAPSTFKGKLSHYYDLPQQSGNPRISIEPPQQQP